MSKDKDPTSMTHEERMAALMRETSPAARMAKAEKMVELVTHEYLDFISVRDMAARRLGKVVPAIPLPPGATPAPLPAARGAIETMHQLIQRYRTDKRSPYSTIRHASRRTYDAHI